MRSQDPGRAIGMCGYPTYCSPVVKMHNAGAGALALQLQHRFRDEETGELMSDNNIGNLVGWYFAGAMVGPLIGGQVHSTAPLPHHYLSWRSMSELICRATCVATPEDRSHQDDCDRQCDRVHLCSRPNSR